MADPNSHMHPPTNSNSGVASSSGQTGTKHKRTPPSSGNMDPGPSQSKKARRAFVKQPRKPKRPSDWHLKKEEVPKEAEKTKVCIYYCHNDHVESLHSFAVL